MNVFGSLPTATLITVTALLYFTCFVKGRGLIIFSLSSAGIDRDIWGRRVRERKMGAGWGGRTGEAVMGEMGARDGEMVERERWVG